MAANRTFQFYGIGCGNTTVTITARVNSTQIFSGTVPTQEIPLIGNQPIVYESILFTVADSALLNTDFSGSLPMTVEVSGGDGVLLGPVFSNYYEGNVTFDPNAGTVDHFNYCYFGEPPNSEATGDTRSSVKINNVQQVPPLEPSAGTWIWAVSSGDTISYNWNIARGQVGQAVGNISNYTAP